MLSVTSEVSSIQPIDGKLREPLEIRRNIRMCFCMKMTLTLKISLAWKY